MPIAWPNTYGQIVISTEAVLQYTQQSIDVAAWAQDQGSSNPDLLDFYAYSYAAQRQSTKTRLTRR